MTQSAISPEVRRFILTSIPSVPHLEALLLLRNEPDVPWSSADLSQRLYVSEKIAATLLSDLAGSGMVVTETAAGRGVRYQPKSDELRIRIDELAAAYSRYLLDITHLIHSKADRGAHQFADAFKLRKDS